MEEKDFEPAGLIPRSIIRTVERFRQQLRPETIALGIQEFRISRYQVRVSVRYFFILLLLPIAINWGAKNIIIKPLVGYFWNTYGESLFLNSYQAERAFKEMRDFESQLFFEMLLSNPHSCPEINRNFQQKEEVLRNTKISLINLSVKKNISKNHAKSWSCSTFKSTKGPSCLDIAPFRPTEGVGQGDYVNGREAKWPEPPCYTLSHEGSCTQNTSFENFKQPIKVVTNEVFQQDSPELALQAFTFKEGFGFSHGLKGRDYKLDKSQIMLSQQKEQNRKIYVKSGLKENECKSQQKYSFSKALPVAAKPTISEISEKTFKNCIIKKKDKRDSLILKKENLYADLEQLDKDQLKANPFKSKFTFRDDLVHTSSIASCWHNACFARSERIPCTASWPLLITSHLEDSGCMGSRAWVSSHIHDTAHAPLSEGLAIETKTPANYEYRKLSQHSMAMKSVEGKENKYNVESYPNIRTYQRKPTSQENSKFGFHDYRFITAEPYNSDFFDRIDTSNCFEVLFQEKTYLLAEIYNQQSITALSNMFGDCIMVISIILLLRLNAPQFTILKSFLIESFYSFNDAIKCFYIILITDFLVGFHSPRGWEIVMEMLLRHLGLPENEEFILLFVGTFPVFLDTAFKYWIFRYLNKISPSTVATYHSMIE